VIRLVLSERLRTTSERAAVPAPSERERAASDQTGPLTASAVLALQRSAGNTAVGRLLQRNASAGLLARQTPSDAPRAGPRLTLSDPRLQDVFESVEKSGRPGPSREAPPSLPWLPRGRTNLPIKMDEGTRRSPKLKDSAAPGGAMCRGACGVDCPSTCKFVGTYREEYVVGGKGYLIEFPNAILCGTHEGCQWHDACFDAAVLQGEDPLSAPIHTYCNAKAVKRYGKDKTWDWMHGRGPYEAWWYFVDNPFVVKSWPVAKR
jgi:hypothetical protein